LVFSEQVDELCGLFSCGWSVKPAWKKKPRKQRITEIVFPFSVESSRGGSEYCIRRWHISWWGAVAMNCLERSVNWKINAWNMRRMWPWNGEGS